MSPARRQSQRVRISTRRSLALWGLGLLCALHAGLYVYVPPGTMLPAGLRLLDNLVPLHIIAWGWAVAAVPMLWCAATRRPGWAAAAAVFIMLGIWGTAYAAGVVQALFDGDPVRSLLVAGFYACIQLIMFSVAPGDHPHRRITDAPPLTEVLPRTVAMLDRQNTIGDAQ